MKLHIEDNFQGWKNRTHIEFTERRGRPAGLTQGADHNPETRVIHFGLLGVDGEPRMTLDRKEVAVLLPFLQEFVKTGFLKPIDQES